MGAHDRRTFLDRQQVGSDRTSDTLVRCRRCHGADETFARCADQKRQAEALELGKPREASDALLRSLAEANAGIEHDVLARDACAVCDLQRAGEEGQHIGDDVYRSIGSLAIVHHDHRHAALGDQRRHIGIALQAPDVVDDGCALVERPGCD